VTLNPEQRAMADLHRLNREIGDLERLTQELADLEAAHRRRGRIIIVKAVILGVAVGEFVWLVTGVLLEWMT
jgi:ferric-dicitrate binding protein FerR (iron transport regulator)